MLFKIVIVSVILSVVKCCHLRDVEVHGVLTDGKPLVTKLTGCIERKSFMDGEKRRNLLEIDINEQNIPRLHKDSIRHLVHLRKLTIRNSNLEVLDLDIFRNTPSLETVDFISNKIEVVRDGVFNFQDFKSVSLYNNQILSMDEMTFANMTHLNVLNISYNKLDSFDKAWFYNVPVLTTIDFQHNEIEMLPANAFGNIRSVRKIYLNHNNIETIEPNAFGGLSSIESLDLSHNLIKELSPSNFPKKFGINTFYINANRLNTLKSALLTVVSVSTISVDGNPWNCFCQRNIYKLFEQKATKVIPSPECRDASIPTCAVADLTACVEEPSEMLTSFYYQQIKKDSPCVRNLEKE